MRTTPDIPDELLDIARSEARDDSPRIYTSPRTGLPILHLSGIAELVPVGG